MTIVGQKLTIPFFKIELLGFQNPGTNILPIIPILFNESPRPL